MRPLRLIVFHRRIRLHTSKPDGYLQQSLSDHLGVSRSLDWGAASYPLDQAPTNAHHAFQVGCGCHTTAPKPNLRVLCKERCRGEKYTFSPAELSGERGEKEVLVDSKQPTVLPSSNSHVSYCAVRARRIADLVVNSMSIYTACHRALLNFFLPIACPSFCPFSVSFPLSLSLSLFHSSLHR